MKKFFECEECPLSWEERSYEGECGDCGCYLYGDLYSNKPVCGFPMFIKQIILNWKKKKIKKTEEHRYDGITEWYCELQTKERAMQSAINETLKESKMKICFYQENGKNYPIGSDSDFGNGYFDASYGEVEEILQKYEDNLKNIECR